MSWILSGRLGPVVVALALGQMLLSGSSRGSAQPPSSTDRWPEFPGTVSQWQGFTRHDFEVDGKPALIVAPSRAAKGRPWVWHGEFFGHKPAPDVELLKRGFHVAYLRVPDLLGAPAAVRHWNAFYAELTGKYGLSPKPALVGLSRGGLYCYNWAAANPERVACIYGDAPVCDFKSWPGGRGRGKGSPRDWKLVMERYGFSTEAEALAYPRNPVDNLAPLAKAKVPLLHVYGDADEVVPWDENTGLVASRYRELGGSVTLICKPGVGHHPHGLEDPTPIVHFILRHTGQPGLPSQRDDPVGQRAARLEPSRMIVYRRVAGRELLLHSFEPEGWRPTDRRPCLLVIHGGGWTGGEPRRMYPFAAHFAKLGGVGISVQYRLARPQQGTPVIECVRDARAAMNFLGEHADLLGIDPQRIVAAGASAGGHLAAGTAIFHQVDEPADAKQTADSVRTEASGGHPPAALILFFPVIDTSAEGYGNRKLGDAWQSLSPRHNVRPGLPPTLIFHGTADTVTPLAGAQAFQAAMQRAGNRCELDIHEGGRHGYLMFDDQLYLQTLARSEAFLKPLGLLPGPSDRHSPAR